MHEVRISIVRWVRSEPQPGIVEAELIDCRGRRWLFREKAAYLSAELLDEGSGYPRPGVIQCEVLDRFRSATGASVVRINTLEPWGVTSLDGESQFEVLAEVLFPSEVEP